MAEKFQIKKFTILHGCFRSKFDIRKLSTSACGGFSDNFVLFSAEIGPPSEN